jgi:tRNA threonylcarbamoyladenosine biosynthesis protein TsaB
MSNTTFKKLGLLLETSSPTASLILTEKDVPLAVEAIDEKENLASCLIERLHQFLEKERCSLSALGFIAASIGPGSYTSLRVGALVAKSLAYALKIPLVGFCSLQCYSPPIVEGSFLVAMDANTRGFYCIKGTKNEGEVTYLENPLLIPLPEANAHLEKFSCRLIPKKDSLQQKFPSFAFIESMPDPHLLAKMVFKKMASASCSQIPELELLYL